MALGRQADRQDNLMLSWAEVPRSPGHVFKDRLQEVLVGCGFDGFVEKHFARYYAARLGRRSIPPGRYFRTHLVSYFGGIDSERNLEWRCSDSLSLRDFLRLEGREHVPDYSSLSQIRSRLPHEVHEAAFTRVLERRGEQGMVQGDRIGADASTMATDAALRLIVRRDGGEGYREMLHRMAQENRIETPTAEDPIRIDRQRQGKKLPNADWVSSSDPEARIAKLKDGTTHLACKPEHAVDLDSGAMITAELHAADRGDTTTLPDTLEAAEVRLVAILEVPPGPQTPTELVADNGYHSRAAMKTLEESAWKTPIAEKKKADVLCWRRDDAARRAVRNNRARLHSGVVRAGFKQRAEVVERSFAHVLDRSGIRRTRLRGRENVHKIYLTHVAGHNLGILMRRLIGARTPKEAVARGLSPGMRGFDDHDCQQILVWRTDQSLIAFVLPDTHDAKLAAAIVILFELSRFSRSSMRFLEIDKWANLSYYRPVNIWP